MALEQNVFFRITSAQNAADYTQSANTLFHFMKQSNFLKNALSNRALYPRFCLEDIAYLNLSVGDKAFNEIAVLQKCFCDIPLHKIATLFELNLTDDSKEKLKDYDRRDITKDNNHLGYYGNFAIAFSKEWCESKNLQPVHYLNEGSSYTREFSNLVNIAINSDTLSDEFVADILQRLALVKPLRGKMKRTDIIDEIPVEIEIIKNFHDEQEWRYVPDPKMLSSVNEKGSYRVESIFANPHYLKWSPGVGKRFIDGQSALIENEQYNSLWLDFDYSHIRYLIVPGNQERLDLIEHILSLPDENFTDATTAPQERYVLISKILVLNEVRKDW